MRIFGKAVKIASKSRAPPPNPHQPPATGGSAGVETPALLLSPTYYPRKKVQTNCC